MGGRWGLLILCAVALALSVGYIRQAGGVREDYLMLVNKEHALPADYVPSDLKVAKVDFATGVTEDRKQMRAQAASALKELFDAAHSDGVALYAVSGYRSYEVQERLYRQCLKERGRDYVSAYLARPGASEHQAGLAMDVSDRKNGKLSPQFADTETYRWLTQNASLYGFIIRYPKDGEAETGYAYEPWHLRYVGEEAKKIADSGLTLEAYMLQYHRTAVHTYPYDFYAKVLDAE